MPFLIDVNGLPLRVIYVLLTLYMLAILVRWVGPYIEMNFYRPALRWLPLITDPLIRLMRRILPPMGPMDWGPIAAVVAVWMVRLILTGH